MAEGAPKSNIPAGLQKVSNKEALQYYAQLQARIDACTLRMVPDIPDAEMKRLREQMKPVLSYQEVGKTEGSVRLKINGQTHYYEQTSRTHPGRVMLYLAERDPRKRSFLVNEKPVGIATGLDLDEVLLMTTFHRGDFFFKPTVAEVLAQINQRVPEEAIPLIRAYEINEIDSYPEVAIPNYLHSVTTVLYTTAELLEKPYVKQG